MHFSNENDVVMIYQWRSHASLKLQFWNYPYHRHNILKCRVSTVNKQHTTLSTVIEDDRLSVQEQFLKISKPWTPNITFREPVCAFKTCSVHISISILFLQPINEISVMSYATFLRVSYSPGVIPVQRIRLHHCSICQLGVMFLWRMFFTWLLLELWRIV